VLKTLNKRLNLKKARENIILCRKYNIKMVAYFMMGCPNESVSEIFKSIILSYKIKVDAIQIAYFTVYDGSLYYTYLKRKQKVSIDYKDAPFHYFTPHIKVSSINPHKLTLLFYFWYLSYYLLFFPKTLFILYQYFLITRNNNKLINRG
jgi:radical SAM superfamily enzyme YgiQ (UPF0313 family)